MYALNSVFMKYFTKSYFFLNRYFVSCKTHEYICARVS